MSKKITCATFDIGASHGRCMLGSFDGSRLELNPIYEFNNLLSKLGSVYYWNAPQQFENVKLGLRKAKSVSDNPIESMGIDSMGCNFVLLDRLNRMISEPYLTRIPQRRAVLEYVFERIPPKELFNITGMHIKKLNTLYHLAEMKMQNNPHLEIAKKLLMVPDVINYWLTGNAISEFSTASTTDIMDIKTLNWSKVITNRMGIDHSIFPEMLNTGERIGVLRSDICEETGLANLNVIATPLHDTASAHMCLGENRNDELFLCLGTYAILGMQTPIPIFDQRLMSGGFAHECTGYKNKIIVYNFHGTSLLIDCINQWKKNGVSVPGYDVLSSEAEMEKSLHTYINPRYPGFIKPDNILNEIHTYCNATNQKTPETRGEVVRTLYESIAMNCKYAVDTLRNVVDKKFNRIRVMGGGSRDRVLCKLIADVLNIDVIAGPSEASSLGNAITQLISIGEIRGENEVDSIINNSFSIDKYYPQNAAIWDNEYERIQGLSIFTE